jgi:hypothetical protein
MKNFLPFYAIFCLSLPLPLTRSIEKEETSPLDASEVQNFIIRKKFPCQSLCDFKLVNLFAWNKASPSVEGRKIAHNVSTLMRTQK